MRQLRYQSNPSNGHSNTTRDSSTAGIVMSPDPIIADPDLHDVRIEKSNVLLIGPSGSGKTHLVKSLAKSGILPFRSVSSVVSRSVRLNRNQPILVKASARAARMLPGSDVRCLTSTSDALDQQGCPGLGWDT